MNIVSYRGPGEPGGVSSALAGVFEENESTGSWWYMKDTALLVACDVVSEAKTLINLSADLTKGHYRYCNEFLWPILHELPQYASYRDGDREHYYRLNEIVSRVIANSSAVRIDSTFFVQDYQFALMPQFLKRFGAQASAIFWHIPWPKNLQSDHAKALVPLAKAMLSSDIIGFHVNEYGENFLRFIQSYLPEFHVDLARMRVSQKEEIVPVFIPSGSYGRARTSLAPRSVRSTEIVIAPLGIDFDQWSAMSQNARATLWQPWLTKKPYVLSVDRADYTKGITYRLKTIDAFFEKYPQWRGEMAFAQICGRTRAGIVAYDKYWQECRALEAKLKEKWDMGHWQPLLWLDRPFSQPQLALLYRNAAVMLVNPIRDGLNLTAKEYVACQGNKLGLLALSRGAGAWQELGQSSLEVRPQDPQQMADVIHQGLTMPPYEKARKMEDLSRRVAKCTLQTWWNRFSKPIDVKKAVSKGFGQLREIS